MVELYTSYKPNKNCQQQCFVVYCQAQQCHTQASNLNRSIRSPGPGCIRILTITGDFLQPCPGGFFQILMDSSVLFSTFSPDLPIIARDKIPQNTGRGCGKSHVILSIFMQPGHCSLIVSSNGFLITLQYIAKRHSLFLGENVNNCAKRFAVLTKLLEQEPRGQRSFLASKHCIPQFIYF